MQLHVCMSVYFGITELNLCSPKFLNDIDSLGCLSVILNSRGMAVLGSFPKGNMLKPLMNDKYNAQTVLCVFKRSTYK